MTMAPIQKLHALHEALADELSKRIANGTATAADLAQARQFLKDNNVEQLAVAGTPLHNLAASLPFAGLAAGDDFNSH